MTPVLSFAIDQTVHYSSFQIAQTSGQYPFLDAAANILDTAGNVPAPPHMKTLCLGGSFNPIHHAHLLCARAVAEKAGFDRVVLIPSCQPPHKPLANDIAPAS